MVLVWAIGYIIGGILSCIFLVTMSGKFGMDYYDDELLVMYVAAWPFTLLIIAIEGTGRLVLYIINFLFRKVPFWIMNNFKKRNELRKEKKSILKKYKQMLGEEDKI